MLYPSISDDHTRVNMTRNRGNTMSELSERLSSISKGVTSLCPVGKLLSEMDTETAKAFEQALAGRATTRVIHTELTNAGIKIGRDTLAAHRNEWCRCKAVKQ